MTLPLSDCAPKRLINVQEIRFLRVNRTTPRDIEAIVELRYKFCAMGPEQSECVLVDIPYRDASDDRPARQRMIEKAFGLAWDRLQSQSDALNVSQSR